MKKVLAIAISLLLILSIAGLACAAEKIFNPEVSAEMVAGYLKLNGYEGYEDYDDGAFLAQLNSLKLRLNTDIDLSDQFSAFLVTQFEMFKDETMDDVDTVSSPVQNYGLIYNPGPVKLSFDAQGRDVVMGIEDQELLKLNVARRYVKQTGLFDPDGDSRLYRYYNDAQAKQLTAEVPFKKGRIVSVFSLEPTPQGDPGAFVGGFGEVTFGSGKYALGYQAKMTNENKKEEHDEYKNPVPAGYIVLATDYQLSDRIRLRLDYSFRDDNGDGYQPWFKPVSELESYDRTPFLITSHLNSILNIGDYQLAARIMNDKYWLDGSYHFKPYTLGANYRNWAFSKENAQAKEDGHVAELYGKYDLKLDGSYLKAFARTDKSMGLCIVVVFE